jgi:hypothetical protein
MSLPADSSVVRRAEGRASAAHASPSGRWAKFWLSQAQTLPELLTLGHVRANILVTESVETA